MTWLPRLLFWLVCLTALSLAGLVAFAPWLKDLPSGEGARPTLRLFAEDAALRKTALASALGLLVTACVFFRQPPEEAEKGPIPPPPAMGA